MKSVHAIIHQKAFYLKPVPNPANGVIGLSLCYGQESALTDVSSDQLLPGWLASYM